MNNKDKEPMTAMQKLINHLVPELYNEDLEGYLLEEKNATAPLLEEIERLKAENDKFSKCNMQDFIFYYAKSKHICTDKVIDVLKSYIYNQ